MSTQLQVLGEDKMAKKKSKFVCQTCAYESPKWMGKCPGCSQWSTLVEEISVETKHRSAGHRGHGQTPVPITDIQTDDEPRIPTGLMEFNRVLGGGIVHGSLILVGGDPGIGKSTLLLQVSGMLSSLQHNVLYISGEESTRQIKMRADRLGVTSEQLLVLAQTDVHLIEEQIEREQPKVVIVDSIQTVYREEITSAPGSVAQVRECTSAFMRIAKTKGIAIFIVGHVTKEGAIAGPRLLEHMVDAVLYFEGDRHHSYRILRSVKNRFGSTNEIGIFEMKEKGLSEVRNPSEMFLEERSSGSSGSVVIASMEGTRPVLVELQSLITPTGFGTPRRMTTGVDHQRVSMIMAVLEKRIGMMLSNHDAYVNIAGGVKLQEPALDLGIAVSIASSFRDQPTSPLDVVIGEIGLTGEVRGINRIEQRVQEAQKLGFKRIIIPSKNLSGWDVPKSIQVIGVNSLQEALEEVSEGR